MTESRPALGRLATRFQQFFQTESSSGIVLLICTVIAMAWANSPLHDSYHALWHTEVGFNIGGFGLTLDLHHWINDALMCVFFFLIGLEIKREIQVGELSNPRQAMLPIMGAIGGMVVPALCYVAFNHGTDYIKGWGVPMATDIAFALAILALLGKRVPLALKVFLAALAIVDDMGAVLVIAIFYTADLNVPMLLLSAGCLLGAAILNKLGVMRLWPYAVFALVLWYAVLQSGVHATIAGVLMALFIPARARINVREFLSETRGLIDRFATTCEDEGKGDQSGHFLSHSQTDIIDALSHASKRVQTPLERLEHFWQVPVAFVIMPIFAFANAGVTLHGANVFKELIHPVSLGIILGLFLGKQIGVMLFSWLAVKLRIADLPAGVSWWKMYAVSLITGIGFTMSLFVANLAFGKDHYMLDTAKLGILLGSVISGTFGYFILKRALELKHGPGGHDDKDSPAPAHG